MTRRARRRRPQRSLAVLAVIVAALLVLYRPANLVVVSLAGAAWAGWRYRRVFRRPRVQRRPVWRPVVPPVARPAGRPRSDARAVRNGWAPPARPVLVTVAVSAECAGGECVLCPGGGCACVCGHDSRVIVAMNTARAGAAEVPRAAVDNGAEPPF
jgi:hypothetical protein